MPTHSMKIGAGAMAFACVFLTAECRAGQVDASSEFSAKIKPIVAKYCYDCHGDGANKGNLALDDARIAENRDVWIKVLKNVRSCLMPPAKEKQPTADEKS